MYHPTPDLLRYFLTDDAIIDLGAVESARGAEAHIMLLAALSGALKTDALNIRVVQSKE